jgi:hypothetical protein
MTDQHTQQLIKETVAHAKNAFFSENSQLASSILDKMEGRIIATIQRELKPLDSKLDSYIKEDNEWKVMAMPVIEMGKSVQGFGKVSLYMLGFIASVSAGFYALMEFFKKN